MYTTHSNLYINEQKQQQLVEKRTSEKIKIIYTLITIFHCIFIFIVFKSNNTILTAQFKIRILNLKIYNLSVCIITLV